MSLIASFLLAGCIIPSAWLLFGCKPWGLGFAGLAGGMMFGLIGYLMARAFVNATTRTPGQKGRAVGCVLGAGVCGVLMVATGGITACYAEVGGPLFTFNALLLFLPLAAAALSPRSGKGAM
jgi:hypothetical protein